MQTQSKYTTLIHTEYVNEFLNPKTDSVPPNLSLRSFIVEYIKSGKDVRPRLIASEYTKKTGQLITRQRIENLLKKLGVYAK